ncbi:TPA: tRNA-specific adenosine deaminase [Candidatus Dependentiae bacterium]|nr:tRNA-specific adenosine deaminase [Candidatus Dependentiae bacterium]
MIDFSEKDYKFMRRAIELAQEAYAIGEVPVGALVVSADGIIIGEGFNRTEMLHCQDQHAEMAAIRQAALRNNDWRLDGCTLYVTLEPCVMCIGCIALSRVERLVYGADSPLYGFGGAREDLCRLYAQTIKNVTKGVCGEEIEALMKAFFRERRLSL